MRRCIHTFTAFVAPTLRFRALLNGEVPEVAVAMV